MDYRIENKALMLKIIEAFDFGNIVDLKVENGELYCAHPMNNSDKIVWFHSYEEGSGFCQMFGC
jgi:hypothetical protein